MTKSKYVPLLILCAILVLSLCSAPISVPAEAAKATATDPWWNTAWPYRVSVLVSGRGVAEAELNFTEIFNTLGLNHALLDLRSVRVVPYYDTTPDDPIPYAETYSTLLEDAENPQTEWSSSGVYWTVNDGDAIADATKASQGDSSVRAIVQNRPEGYGYPGVELHIADGDPLTDWSHYEVFLYDVWPEVNDSARDQAPDLYWYKLYNACATDPVTQGGPPLALNQWNHASVSLNPLDTCWPSDGLDLSSITRMEFHTRDNETVHGNGGFWDDGDELTLWFDNLKLVDQDNGALRWNAEDDVTKYYIYFDVLTHEGHPLPILDDTIDSPTLTSIVGDPEAGGYYHQITDADTAGLNIWAAPTVEKILKTMVAPTVSAPLRVSAARGEFEPFQLVVQSTTPQEDLSILVSQFTQGDNVIPAPAIHRVDYVNITTAGDHYDRLGWWPDPLWPLNNGDAISLSANENQPLWFTLQVPWDAEPGLYHGIVTIGGASVPVELEVWNFSLPHEIHLDSEWGFGWSNIVDIYGGTRNGSVQDCYWEVVDALKQDFINHRLVPKGVAWPAGLNYPGGIEYDCDTGTLYPDNDGDWDFATLGGKYIHGEGGFNDGYGFPVFLSHGPKSNWPPDSLPSSFCGISRDSTLGSATFQAKWQQYLSAVDAYIVSDDYADAAYYHIVNEPQTFDDYTIVGQISALTEDAAPHLRQMVSEQVEPQIYTHPGAKIDIWMPTISSYEPVKSHDRQKNYDEEVWWYYLYGDDPPLPNPILMSHPGVEARLTPWLAWAERVDGLLHYSVTDWSSNPWDTPNVTGQDNGDAFFFYPPRKDGNNLPVCAPNDAHKLVPSIRWENLRDGMEDYEYLWLLAEGDPDIDVANAADVYVAQLVQSRTRFSHVPTELDTARAAIAAELGGPPPSIDPPTMLTLTGPQGGVINTAYTFQATVNATATLPLTYTWAADGHSPVSRAGNATTDSINMRWETPGAKTITVTVGNTGGNLTKTSAFTVANTLTTTASPTQSGTLVYTDTQDNPTGVFIPTEAVTTTVEFRYTPHGDRSTGSPEGFSFMHHNFALDAYIAGVKQASFSLAGPLTITIAYSDADLGELDESNLRLYYITLGSVWPAAVDAANTCYQQDQNTIIIGPPEALERYYTRDPDKNQVAVQVCHLSDFSLLGPEKAKQGVYLPLVLRLQ